MTTTEQSAQSIMDQQRAKRAEFNTLWQSRILPRIVELTKHAPKGKSPAEIAIDMAWESSWIAFNK